MPRDDLFPIELLGRQAQESLLAEFGGRHPTISEMATFAEADLLKLPGVGPSTIRKVQLFTQSGIASSSVIARLSDDELQSERGRLLAKLIDLRDEFIHREHELRGHLTAIRRELRLRGVSRE